MFAEPESLGRVRQGHLLDMHKLAERVQSVREQDGKADGVSPSPPVRGTALLADPIAFIPDPAEIHERIGRHKREIDVLRRMLKAAEQASLWRRGEAAHAASKATKAETKPDA